MKIKPIFIYLTAFAAFVIGIIIFSSSSQKTNSSAGIPDDAVHSKTNPHGNGEMPGKGNVTQSAMEKMAELEKDYKANPNDTLKAREYADFIGMAHGDDEALGIYDNILKIDPNRIDIIMRQTFIYDNKGNYDKAEELTKKILSLQKDHPDANYNLGVIAAQKGQNDKALKIFNDVLKKFPNTQVAEYSKIYIEQLTGKKK